VSRWRSNSKALQHGTQSFSRAQFNANSRIHRRSDRGGWRRLVFLLRRIDHRRAQQRDRSQHANPCATIAKLQQQFVYRWAARDRSIIHGDIQFFEQSSESFNQGQNIGTVFLNFFIAGIEKKTSIKSFCAVKP
jgi:hypothetical protein